ncbi:hypothetical protein HZA97_02005 [Candidatus Woesearchaeota archaeon]|nr:hypothetical protein [Candidatus Woesearchaeota archaeon]
MKKYRNITIAFEKSSFNKLKQICIEESRSISNYVKFILKESLRNEKKK